MPCTTSVTTSPKDIPMSIRMILRKASFCRDLMALSVSIPSTSSSVGRGPFSLRLDTLVIPERLSLPPKVTSVSFMAQVVASQSPHPEVCCHQLFSGAFSREAGSGLSHQPGKPLVLRLSRGGNGSRHQQTGTLAIYWVSWNSYFTIGAQVEYKGSLISNREKDNVLPCRDISWAECG